MAVVEKPETIEVWRNVTMGWTEEARCRLISEISRYQLREIVKVPHVNVAMIGQIGSGKSSVFNTLNSIYRGYPTKRATAGNALHSLTKAFRAYALHERAYAAPKIRLCDTMGLEENGGLDISDIAYILDGNVPDNFQFNPAAKLTPNDRDFRREPKLKDEMHVVAFVVDVSKYEVMSTELWKKLNDIKEHALARGIPFLVLLTKIDKQCSLITKSVSDVYCSQKIAQAVEFVAEKFGTSRMDVFPIKNYESELELDLATDILLLTAVRQMIRLAENHFDDVIDRLDQKRGVPCKKHAANEEVLNAVD